MGEVDMGWGIYVRMYLSKLTPEQVPDAIEVASCATKNLRERILMHAAAGPVAVPDSEGNADHPVNSLHYEVSALLDELAGEEMRLALLEAYQSDPDDAELDPP